LTRGEQPEKIEKPVECFDIQAQGRISARPREFARLVHWLILPWLQTFGSKIFNKLISRICKSLVGYVPKNCVYCNGFL